MSCPYDYLFKLIVIGNAGTGKTSLCQKYIDGRTVPYYDTTIGVEFFSKIVEFGEDAKHEILRNKKFKIQIWDTAGQEAFRSIIKSYYRDVAGVFLVCDLTRRSSLNDLKYWIDEVKKHSSNSNPEYILICNKKDLTDKYAIFHEDIRNFCEDNKITYKFTTYKNDSMKSAVELMINNIYTRYKTGPKLEEYPGIRKHQMIQENKIRDLCVGYSRGRHNCCSIV